jgi:hypothetical protein
VGPQLIQFCCLQPALELSAHGLQGRRRQKPTSAGQQASKSPGQVRTREFRGQWHACTLGGGGRRAGSRQKTPTLSAFFLRLLSTRRAELGKERSRLA